MHAKCRPENLKGRDHLGGGGGGPGVKQNFSQNWGGVGEC
jgi:hypothetical protein